MITEKEKGLPSYKPLFEAIKRAEQLREEMAAQQAAVPGVAAYEAAKDEVRRLQQAFSVDRQILALKEAADMVVFKSPSDGR